MDVITPVDELLLHDAHWETDRFATWVAYYDALGEMPAQWAFQVFWADAAGTLASTIGG